MIKVFDVALPLQSSISCRLANAVQPSSEALELDVIVLAQGCSSSIQKRTQQR